MLGPVSALSGVPAPAAQAPRPETAVDSKIGQGIGVHKRPVPYEEYTRMMFTEDELRKLLWMVKPYGDWKGTEQKGQVIDFRS